MKKYIQYALVSMLSVLMWACSSDETGDGVQTRDGKVVLAKARVVAAGACCVVSRCNVVTATMPLSITVALCATTLLAAVARVPTSCVAL